jgi:hypothetical protein
MKKLIIFCLILFLGSCKEQEVVEELDPDYSSNFVGSYSTKTLFDTYNTVEVWDITKLDKNLLAIGYTIVYNSTGLVNKKYTYIYSLKNVVAKDSATIVINESADWDFDGTKLRAKLEGTGKKSTVNGLTMISIGDLKITDLADNKVTTREYLEFKKK